MTAHSARAATVADAAAIAEIYNQGIEDRIGTFETVLRSHEDIESWFNDRQPTIAVTDDAGQVVAFAATFPYADRCVYSGIAEFSVYVSRDRRGLGAGRLAMTALVEASTRAGFWKLLSRVFPENAASRSMLKSVGFREVGIHERHGRLDGVWRDVIAVELLIIQNQDD